MRSDQEYDKLHTELRDEIGARHGLPDNATAMIPLVEPDAMRDHAKKMAELLHSKPAEGADDKKPGAADVKKPGGLDPTKMNKRLDQFLGHYYKVPGQK